MYQPHRSQRSTSECVCLISILIASELGHTKMFLGLVPRLTLVLVLCCLLMNCCCWSEGGEVVTTTCSNIVPVRDRTDKISLTDFGGVGDGFTLNTKAFREAVYRIQRLPREGGTTLYVPPGVYLTEPFNLTSHMTLYLAAAAVIKATQVSSPFLSPILFIIFLFLFF